MADNDQIAVELVAKTDAFNAAMAGAVQSMQSAAASFNQSSAAIVSAIDRVKAKNAEAVSSTGLLDEAFKRLAGTIAAGFSVEKIIGLGVASVETADHLEKMSQQVGIATDALSALQSQAALSDVGFDQFGQAMSRLARSATEAAGGSQRQAAAFQAIGVSVTNAAGQMRPMQEILQDVAAKMSGYADGASKTALAQELMGRGGAALIPLLNELGTQGFGAVTKAAEEYNQVIGPEQAKQSETLHDNFTRLQQATSGFANAVMHDLLPGLVALSTDMAEAAKTNTGYADSASVVSNSIKGIVFAVLTVKETLSAAITIMIGFYDAVATSFSAAGQIIAAWATATKERIHAAFTLDASAFSQAGNQYTQQLTAIGTAVGNKFRTIGSNISLAMGDSTKNVVEDFNKLFGTISTGTTKAASDVTKPQAPIVALGNAANDAGKAARELDAAMDKLANDLDSLAGKLGGPYAQAQSDYNRTVRQLENDAEAAAIAGGDVTDIIDKWQQGEALAGEVLAKTNQQIEQQHNLFAQQSLDLQNTLQVLQLEPQYRQAATQALQKYDDLLKSHYDFYGNYIKDEGDLKAALDAQLPSYEAGLQHINDITEAQKRSDEATKDWVNIWQQAGDQLASTFASILVNGGSLFDSLVSLAKQTVEQIIAYFAKLAIINPILNAIFGGSSGFSLLPTLGSLGASAAGAAYTGSFNMGGPSGVSAASNASMFGTAGQGLSLFSAGFQHGMDYALFGGSSDASGMFGSYSAGGSYGLGVTGDFAPSALGYGLSIAGGAYAAYNEYNRAGGGAAGAAGGLTYGVGTTALGLGAASLATGGGVVAGLSVLGPIGWAAIALMAVDMLSGGKLFGTAGKFNFGQQAVTVDSSGAVVSAGYDLKGQKPLFGGSTHSWQNLPVDPAAQAAADQFFQALKNSTEDFAKQFGAKVGDIVGGQFIATFDKHGNITKTQSTVLGQTYNDTQQQFEERLQAENMLAVLGQFDKGLNDAVNQFRANADQLMAVTQALAQGESMFQAGTNFLALGTDQSLTELLKLAEGSQRFGETIDQTLQRIEQAQSQYDQFVAQFKPSTNYVDDFEASLAAIRDQMNANIKQANALAIAAGAQGASEKDLANIHQYAAHQAAQAIAALEASAQSLAFSLGLTTVGSLDQVNQEIAALQAKANQGSGAVENFGNAMQKASQKATDAINLLLGDLSPLNDQQKLQIALQGLRAGTVTQEQVLQIGRNLYASSQQYVDLFHMVQSMGGGANAAQQTGGGGTSAGGGGLTSAERQRLSDLLKEQQQLQAAAQLQQYQTLAQQVAEIASAKGEDWQQVLKDMGIDEKAFEKGLGMTEAQLGDYITAIQKQTDSNGDNTKSIVDVLNQILQALGGTPTSAPVRPTDQGGGATSPAPPPGHSGHGIDGADIGRQIARAFSDALQTSGPRNLRLARS